MVIHQLGCTSNKNSSIVAYKNTAVKRVIPSPDKVWTKMNAPTELLKQDELRMLEERGELEEWMLDHYHYFHEELISEDGNPFPCFLGMEAEVEASLRYTFCKSMTDRDALESFRSTLIKFVRNYREMEGRSSLIVFFQKPQSELSENRYFERFWDILQFLHDTDPKPWPDDMPIDPEHPQWGFCFNDEWMFFTARAPFYTKRHSRRNPHGLELTINPAGAFEDIPESSTKGQRARERIRRRLVEYDDVAPHPYLGDYSDEESREWKQFMLPDDNGTRWGTCPLETER